MTSQVHGSGGPKPGFHLPGEAKGPAAALGSWNGLAVQVSDDPASLLADAAEELTFAASETVEKEVTERKKPEKQKRIVQVVPPAEAMADLQQRMAERLARLLQQARAAMGNPAAFRAALEAFPDPTERHAALCWLEEQLVDEPSLAAMARREREALEAESAPEVQAGYNIAGVEAGPEGLGAGTDLYRRTILGHEGIGAMLEEVLERHGTDDFAGTVDFLRRAVGADLSAATPSTDKRELEAMNNDLFHLRAIANFTREFDAEIAGLREKGDKEPLSRAGLDTLRLFCKAKDERLVMLDGLRTILKLEGEKDATYDVLALTGAHRLAHNLPNRIFADEDSRQRLLTAGQKLLDQAIDLEESLLGDE